MADLTGSFGQGTSSRETAPLTEVFILDLSAYVHPANQRTWSLQNRMYRLWRKRGKMPWALTTPEVFPLARETLLSGGSLELMPPNSCWPALSQHPTQPRLQTSQVPFHGHICVVTRFLLELSIPCKQTLLLLALRCL